MNLKSLGTVISFLLSMGAPSRVEAQTNRDCLSCHGDKTLTRVRDGATISLYVDSAKLAVSRHGPTRCVDCHRDLIGKSGPHAANLARAACRTCHVTEAVDDAQSLHGKAVARGDPLAPTCGSCHGSHDIVAMKDPRSRVLAGRVAALCGSCHSAGAPVHRQRAPADATANFPERIHGDLLAKRGMVAAATCVSCHTAHRVLATSDDRSSIARRNIGATCSQCHSQLPMLHQKVIPVAAWKAGPSSLLACVTCHVPHGSGPGLTTASAASNECQRCHARPDITSSTDGHSLWVGSVELAGSMHKTVACTQCHTGVDPSHARPSGPATRKVDCTACHAETARQYRLSTHGMLWAKGDTNAPTCAECHGTHSILNKHNPDSPTYPLNIPTLCARCHRTGEKAAVRYTGRQTEIVEGYTESIHGTGLLKSGLIVTATCISCHTAHSELPHDSLASSVSSANVPTTCGACHAGIQEKFETSVHSVKVTATAKPLPVCSTCHSAHTIGRTDADGFKLGVMDRCGKCHEAIAKTYFDTYHGKVSRLGFTRTAQCSDCHGSHEIVPVRDARSPLSKANIVATCQKCHANAGPGFAGYLPHATHTDRAKYPWLFWTFWAMTALLVGVFTVFGAHTLLWLRRGLILKRQARVNSAPTEGAEPGVPSTPAEELPPAAVVPSPAGNALEYRRFQRLDRVLHVVMIVSFLLAAATGMTLKFSNTRWASILSHLFGGFQTAGYIHRISAVLMIGLFLTHLVDLVRRPRKSWKDLLFGPNTMIPTPRDAVEVFGTVKWFLGLGPRPRYGRWTYWEKFDYMGVFWGMVVIGSTGLMLWFPVFATRFLPGWSINVATIIHSDEALLAAGFIFTIHFFNTHLRPEKFPMDIVVFTGRMTVEELKHDKPAEYDALVASGELEENLVEPYPPVVIGVIRAFGWMALAVGVSIAVWIVYAMVFANG